VVTCSVTGWPSRSLASIGRQFFLLAGANPLVSNGSLLTSRAWLTKACHLSPRPLSRRRWRPATSRSWRDRFIATLWPDDGSPMREVVANAIGVWRRIDDDEWWITSFQVTKLA
jgi:hypothetical protein